MPERRVVTVAVLPHAHGYTVMTRRYEGGKHVGGKVWSTGHVDYLFPVRSLGDVAMVAKFYGRESSEFARACAEYRVLA